MSKEIEIRVAPEELGNSELHLELVAKKLELNSEQIAEIRLRRRSIDARHRKVSFMLRYVVGIDKALEATRSFSPSYQKVSKELSAVVIGAGPAGLFAALKLIELGIRPIVIERGKDVRARRKDIADASRGKRINPDSNYCFGEGGAGTFSDGKLYTRATKRGDVNRILNLLVHHGATQDILIDTHPHIGTNKLPAVIERIRETIIEFGGEILFNERVSNFRIINNCLKAVETSSGLKIETSAAVLATGHSARDIFECLRRNNVLLEAKPFALGVRVEHPQALIDQVQYSQSPRHPNLPAASYALRAQAADRGVFSFCMCPGGVICPAATAEGEIVVNGWSPSKRNSPYANSGIVVEIRNEDLADYGKDPVWAGIELQKFHETNAFSAGGGELKAPAQRLSDFLDGKTSATLPDCSYNPGITSSNLAEVLNPKITARLLEGLKVFGKKIPGYLTNEAIVVATESRTSSPIKIPRDHKSMMHSEIEGLFPCGEGAGYAGGIMSAAIDGERVAAAVEKFLV